MTNRFLDSCSHYATADIAQKYPSATGTTTINATGGRFGGGALQAVSNSGTSIPIVRDNQASWFLGFAFKASVALTQAAVLARFYDGGTIQVTVALNSNGTVTAYRGDTNGTALGTSTLTINPLAYPYIEIGATINNTTGVVTVKANETTILSLTGQNTRATANNQANEVRLAQTSNATLNWCDIYLNDGSGAANNTFWGDTRVDAKFPTGTGTTNDWTANGAANAWDCVDDATPDGDSTYISSATVNQVATFVTQDVAAGATVRAVQWIASARKDDAGTRTIAPVLRSGGADRVGTSQNLSAAYTMYTQQYDTDPADSASWTPTKFNALETGAKLIA